MTTTFDLMQQPSIAALAWTLIHFLWQGALLGGAAFLTLRVVRPESAATRYAIGVAALAAMVITCAITFAIEMRSQPAAVIVSSASPATSASASGRTGSGELRRDSAVAAFRREGGPAVSMAGAVTASPTAWAVDPLDSRLLPLIVIAWLTGVLAMSVRLIGGWVLTRQMARRAAVAVSPAIESSARAIAARLHVRRAVAILESQLVAVPTLIGWLKPVVLLPTAALAGLSPDQLRAILAHELAHVRRHDYLVNLLQSIVETLLFYHPATWWVSAQIRSEREHCCDDLAVDVCGDRLLYASALAELTTMAGHRSLALAATDGSLLNRVRRILGGQGSMHEPAPALPLLALVVLVVAAASFSASASARKSSSELQRRATDHTLQATESTLAAVPVTPSSMATTAAAAPVAASTAAPAGSQSTASVTTDEQLVAATFAQTDAVRAEASQAADVAAQLSEQAKWLSAEAARLRAEADMIRRTEAELRRVQDAFGLAPPPPPPSERSPSEPPPSPSASARDGSGELRRDRAESAFGREAGPSQETGVRGSGNMTWSDNGESLSVRWTGAFRLNEDETDIDWLDNGATVTITDGLILRSRVDLRGTSNGIERSYSRNGQRRDYEPEGRAFLTAAIDRLIRHSGAFAKDRVARFLKRGGPDAVLAQIDRLSESSYVRRVYYSELLTQAPATDALLGTVLDRVTTEVTSNYDKATLFTQAAGLPAITDSHRVAIARAVKSISSSYDQRRSLTAIVTRTPLAAIVAAAVVDAVASISSNHDRAEVLIDVAEHGGVTAATAPAFMERVRTTSSSHDQRRVLTAVAAHASLTDAVGVEVARTIGAITSSHDQSSMLITLVDRGGLTDNNAQAFFDSAARISSSYDMSRVLRKVVEQSPNNERLINGVLKLAPKVSSSHDRANVLIDVAARSRVGGETRQLYIAASSGLGNHDENRVLAALVRAEGRQ
jgi:beta-lactamase regulating signal transducer with metallopeptidase domain